ncbi:ribonuclease H-like domain-containing protein [Rhizophagus irregularis DAOM 181602=DAOM 197198]|uniref:Peptidase A2 domain-containing protein n=2 Tax=Rhizophagus irregularis TaxID=588596 RepID=A0A015L159_RHIIW|nr:hypothetical protein RirG_137420 [Rhizophagus irregularis DAOM 197198w]GBC16653.1 ribonuclease H-like domain-containing protein [Rhizophagus irregularis DAOM 181602=DAOM 197198]EXX67036.1 hypothetical protein RirG_118090 [Rhizophagus irregularis DAOM 197198w]EXX73559.1 hypothetical protein RirG_059240 [Rhizophagus irregularis DAOM 197198w]GBC17715.1 ribonuclease H-like domain-containing protein [Rhizophagus irregularis DAOM 181602=DAOM 197198]
MKTQFIINDKEIEVVIDSGAAISVITEKLRKELNIPIKGKSNITCTLADGGKIASLGKVNTEIKVYKELVLPVTLDVIDSKQKEMIIGNDLLDKWNANINYKEKILELENDEEIIDIPVWYIKQVEESEESDYESESGESDYEQEEGKKLYTVKEAIKEKEVVKENESQEDSESSSEESSSDDSEISSENED